MNKEFGTEPKKRKKLALGRGLDALIPDVADEARVKDFFECDVSLIRRSRYQPRKRFSDEDLAELADSIRAQGVIQPLLVREQDSGYELVAGERRLRAAIMAGLKEVPVVVKSVSDADMLEISIVENIQRENLNPIEEAEAYHRLITEFGLTQDKAAARVGKSRSAVANFLRLRNLPREIQDSIVEGRLSMGHARALLGTESKAQQIRVWQTILAKNLSVRQTENLIKRTKVVQAKPADSPPTTEQIHFADLASELSRHFGTKVEIRKRGKAGRVSIEFYSDTDLDRLIRLLKNAQ
jgi:ParB family chromosome partitioning protein